MPFSGIAMPPVRCAAPELAWGKLESEGAEGAMSHRCIAACWKTGSVPQRQGLGPPFLGPKQPQLRAVRPST